MRIDPERVLRSVWVAVPAFLGDLEIFPNDLNMLLQLGDDGNGTGRGNAWHERAIRKKDDSQAHGLPFAARISHFTANPSAFFGLR